MVKESEIVQISQWTAHTDAIRSIQYINVTDSPVILTAGLDKFVHIFSVLGEPRGTLKQGYMMKTNYLWDWKMETYDDKLAERQDAIHQMLIAQK